MVDLWFGFLEEILYPKDSQSVWYSSLPSNIRNHPETMTSWLSTGKYWDFFAPHRGITGGSPRGTRLEVGVQTSRVPHLSEIWKRLPSIRSWGILPWMVYNGFGIRGYPYATGNLHINTCRIGITWFCHLTYAIGLWGFIWIF